MHFSSKIEEINGEFYEVIIFWLTAGRSRLCNVHINMPTSSEGKNVLMGACKYYQATVFHGAYSEFDFTNQMLLVQLLEGNAALFRVPMNITIIFKTT